MSMSVMYNSLRMWGLGRGCAMFMYMAGKYVDLTRYAPTCSYKPWWVGGWGGGVCIPHFKVGGGGEGEPTDRSS